MKRGGEKKERMSHAETPSELWSARVVPFLGYPARASFEACCLGARAQADADAGRAEAMAARSVELLLRAGAPRALVDRLDAGRASAPWRWMERRDSAFATESGYVDYLGPGDFGPRHPVLYGRDAFDRFCLAASFVWRGRAGVACLFQRYAGDPSLLVNCRDCLSEGVELSTAPALAAHHARIADLVSRGWCSPAGGGGDDDDVAHLAV